jgi:PAS domain S-box-containing protein
MGSGMLGGRLVNYEALGTRAAETGLRIFAGESPQNIPLQIVPSATMFDWRELRRWGIDESKLPAGSIVRFKEPTFWERYKWRIIGVISLCILEALLIVGLLISRARRREAERENEHLARAAETERRRLDEVVSNVPGIVWETRFEADRKTRKTYFVSDYVEQMLGYSVEEWLATPNFALTIMTDEDRGRIASETKAILESGNAGFLQFRWLAKDGSLHWVEAQVTAISDATGKTVGLRGVTMDVTEHRLAEELLRESDERLKQAISVARFGVFEHDHLTGILHSSPLTQEIHAWGEEITSSLEGLVAQLHPEDRETFIAALGQAHDPAGDGFFSREYRIVLDGGKVRWVSARAQTFFEGENGARHPVRTVGAELDITERKETEEALRTAAEEVSRLKNQLQAENIYLQEEIKLAHNVDEIVGQSNAIKYVLFKIEQVAETDTTVLILGETGTGKELVARAIHSQSSRKDRPLVKVNCAALSASLIESELFGHEKGAFTGASARKIGRFELAHGATLFLDEIGELPLELQAKLLRVIQEGEFERLGSSKTVKVEVRIIAATNRSMKAEIERGSFREDLWYRLNVFPITVPPLRQRKEDIPPMVEHFVNGFSKKLGKPINSISAATLKKLQDYSWPGNVRELANVIERAVINAQGSVLHIADQFEQLQSEELSISIKTLEEMEKEYITRILDDTAWRIEGPNGAARILGLNPSTLRTRMIKLGIQKSIRSFAGSSGK